MFAPIYEGCKCGETFKVTRHQIIDTERDDVWEELVCDVCGSSVIKEKMIDGKPCWHPLSDEEIQAEMYRDDYVADDEEDWQTLYLTLKHWRCRPC